MEDDIQRILDAQVDALESRNNKVKIIRRELYDAIRLLADQCNGNVSRIDAQTEEDRGFIQKESHYLAKREDIKRQLIEEEQSELHGSLKSLEKEIHDLDEQIKQLQAKRGLLDTQRQQLASTYSSRTVKLKDFLSDLDIAHPVENADLVEATKRRIEANKQVRKGALLESKAALEGSDLWLQVCEELDSLDNELKGLKRDQLPQMAFLLSKTSSTVNDYLTTATNNGWSVLIVAIGHELHILHDTQTAIQKVVLDK